MHKKKGKYVVLMFKIDFEKAYDAVNWEFLKLGGITLVLKASWTKVQTS